MHAGAILAGELRQEAEKRHHNRTVCPVEELAAVDIRALLHELQVHQIELELQNEELQRARAVAEAESEKYQDLFDFAPVGYFLCTANGRICEVNLAGAALLGFDRSLVVGRRLGQFIITEHRLRFADFCQQVLLADDMQSCEVEILRNGLTVDVLIEGIAVRDSSGQKRICRAALIDISQQKRAGQLAAANLALEAAVARQKQVEATLEQRISERTEAIQMLHDIVTVASQVHNAEQVIGYCLRRVAMCKGWCFGHAYLQAADNPDELASANACYCADPERFRRFCEERRGLRVRRGQGLPGRVLASGKLQCTTDLRGDFAACRAPSAEELGIRSAVAFPVMLGDKVAAVLELFSDQVIESDDKLVTAMTSVGLQIGRVMERTAFEEYLLEVADDVRRDIALELHDDIGQELTGLRFKALTLTELLGTCPKMAKKLAGTIAAHVDRTHDKLRGLSRGILPIELREGLLAGALEQLAVATRESSHIQCKFICVHPHPFFNSRVSMHLYRIAQEAVGNAMRHSGASRIRIRLAQENGDIVLRIEDDGTAISAEVDQAMGMGLRTMRYRAELLGGNLAIGPGANRGTRVECTLPTPPRILNPESARDA